ncbi:MAG TPA: hypothetical protein VFZ21_06495 [Gemmatimonadaceae bacterium]|jgi:hypothetical protein|nr:hypothetical protein [Gemmatimonadaceae bacterium]
MSRWLGASYWRHVSPDSIEIVWRNGRYGSAFRLAQAGDVLRGRVQFTSDIRFAERGPANPGAAAEATGARIECPAD